MAARSKEVACFSRLEELDPGLVDEITPKCCNDVFTLGNATTSERVTKSTCGTAVNLIPASAEDAAEGCIGMTSLNVHTPQRLHVTSTPHHSTATQGSAFCSRGTLALRTHSWVLVNTTEYGCSCQEAVGGLQATRPLQGTTAETTELHTQAQVTGEGYQHECWLGPPARQQSTPSPQRTEHGCAARARGPREWSGWDLKPPTSEHVTRVCSSTRARWPRHSKHFLERGVTPHRTVHFPVMAHRHDPPRSRGFT